MVTGRDRLDRTDIPFWQKALRTVSLPFDWISRNVTQPFGTLVTAPWTPAVRGTEHLPWWQREQAEYKAWEDPGISFRMPWMEETEKPWKIGVKGFVETLPWLAVPSAAGVLGRAGTLGMRGAGLLGLAQQPGHLGRGAALAAKAVAPLAKAERIATYPIAKPLEMVGRGISKAISPKSERAMRSLVNELRGIREQRLSGVLDDLSFLKGQKEIAEKVLQIELRDAGKRAWKSILRKTEKELKKAELAPKIKPPVPKVEAGIPPPPPPFKPRLVSELYPDGFGPEREEAAMRLLDAVRVSKPITKETAALRVPVRGKRARSYEEILQEYIKQGKSVEEAHQIAKGAALRGEYPRASLTPEFQAAVEKLGKDQETLFRMISDAPLRGFEKGNTIEAFQKLLLEQQLQPNEIVLLERVFGSKLVKEIMKKRPLGERAWNLFLDVLNAPRALLASCDISGLLRQGAILSARHPIEGIKTVGPSVRAMLSDKNSIFYDNIIRSRKWMDVVLDPKLPVVLDLTALPYKEAAALTRFEESFASKIMNKIPFVRASNRAYVTVLNDMRSRSVGNVLNGWEKMGLRYNPKIERWIEGGREFGFLDVSDLNQMVNWASGRGTLPRGLQQQGRLLNGLIFAPKLQMSRIQLPMMAGKALASYLSFGAYMPYSGLMRKEIMRTVLSFLGAGSGILTMAALSGVAEVELDPRSADFGKLKYGETRLDIWSGYSQLMRFTAQLATAQRKSVSGRVYDVNRRDIGIRFLQTKASPAAGLVNDLLTGESFLGEEMPPKSARSAWGQVYQRMAPLAIQDMIDATLEDGPVGTVVSSVGILGIGVVTYTDEARRERDKAANAKYGVDWEELGRQYEGRIKQLLLEQETPAILEADKEEEKRFTAGTPTLMQHFQDEGQSIEDTYREDVNLAVKKFRVTGDGREFRLAINQAAETRRRRYGARAKMEKYEDIIAYYNQPLKPEQIAQMDPGNVLRREHNQFMYGQDMFDEYGEYRFDEAERREQEFLKKHGQKALDYIEEYRSARWIDKPAELKMLEQARDILRPYWQMEDQIWSMYPPELKVLSDQIKIMERTDPVRARRALRRYPQILRARELIARYKKAMRDRSPMILQAYNLFYR